MPRHTKISPSLYTRNHPVDQSNTRDRRRAAGSRWVLFVLAGTGLLFAGLQAVMGVSV